MNKKKFIIIDANSLIHRAFHALPPLTTKKGELVNAVFGFATILLKALKEFKPDYIACCFDVDKDTFRKREFKEYKAHRAEQPNELYFQFPLIKELLEAFHIPVYEKKGFEADDIIGTITKLTRKEVPETKALVSGTSKLLNIIVSGDLDNLQLVDDNTEVYTMKRGISDTIIYDEKAVRERYDLSPEQLIDMKALAGDQSDNIPGVRGVGEKTAIALIKVYGDLENVYNAAQEAQEAQKHKNTKTQKHYLLKDSLVEKLLANKREAFLSKKLATIARDVKIDFDLKDAQVEPFDTEAVVKLFQAWNFTSLISKIPNAEKVMLEKQGTLFGLSASVPQYCGTTADKLQMKKGYHLINDEKSFKEFISQLKHQTEFAFDTETDGLNPFKSNLIGISFSWQKGEAWYLPFGQFPISNFQFPNKSQIPNPKSQNLQFTIYKLQVTPLFKPLTKILEDSSIKKVGHNLKFDYEVLEQAGIKLQGLAFDTMIASYLLNPGTRQHSLDNLAFVELGYKMQSIQQLAQEKDKPRTFSQDIKSSKKDLLINHQSPQQSHGYPEKVRGKSKIDLSKLLVGQVANYSCEDVDITWQLYHKLSEKLDEALIEGVLEKIEMPLIPILAQMEKIGIKLDIEFLNQMNKRLEAGIRRLEAGIRKMAGAKFNVASPIQLKQILFDKLKISAAGLGRTKTGISTAAGELEKLRGRHKIIDLIMEFRELSKLKNTYLEPLPKLADEQARVHTSFNQTVTATGRLSSSDPNLQNIPIRTDLGKEIRKAFVAEKSYQILAADYSQIELRIVASLANDRKMLEAFNKKLDIHTQTAAEIFGIQPGKISKQMRRQAKAVNFGIIYGLGARGLSAGTGISYEEAQEFIERYFEVFGGIKNYIEETIALTRELGYVETLFGRRRYLPEINANHQQMRSQAERMAINHPVHGSSADLIKLAMINIHKKIKKEFAPDQIRMLLQVHDELVFEVKSDLIKHASKIIKDEMESVYKLKAPIEVEIGVGKSWGEAK